MEPTVTRLDATLGATITGIDLGALDGAAWRLVEDAFHEHGPPTGVDDDWKTTYTYNARSQLIAKDTPDTDDAFEYKYDAKGNLRFVNDPNHVNRTGSGFLYTKYDDFDRVVQTGVYVGPTLFNDANLTNVNWPTNASHVTEVVSYTYDDDNPDQLPHPLMTFHNPKGHLKEVVFDGGYYQYNYDDVGRVLEFYASLDGLGGKLVKYVYDRMGNAKSIHYQAGESDELELIYTYDDAGRLQKVESQVLGESQVQEAFYTYTPTGQVQTFLLGEPPGALPEIEYTYHIRDWLIQINDPAALGGDKFAMALGYDEAVVTGAPTLHNGNIGSVEWVTEGNNAPFPRVGYTFDYDALNRLEKADFRHYNNGWVENNAYDVGVGVPIDYDPNGNIEQLIRRAPGTSTTIDYSYEAGRNRLEEVTIDGTLYPFAYDDNGNMTKSRVAEPIDYDRRNLPTQMTLGGDGLTFRYDADGQRIYKQLDTGGGTTKTFYLRGVDGSVLAVYIDQGSGPQLQYWNILSGGAVIGRIVPASGTN